MTIPIVGKAVLEEANQADEDWIKIGTVGTEVIWTRNPALEGRQNEAQRILEDVGETADSSESGGDSGSSSEEEDQGNESGG